MISKMEEDKNTLSADRETTMVHSNPTRHYTLKRVQVSSSPATLLDHYLLITQVVFTIFTTISSIFYYRYLLLVPTTIAILL